MFWCKITQHEECVNLEVVDWQGVINLKNPRGIIGVEFYRKEEVDHHDIMARRRGRG